MRSTESRHNALEYSLQKERAGALGAAGRQVQEALAALHAAVEVDAATREKLLYAAANKVWRYFVCREACGIREHEAAIEEYGIPKQVLARVGARQPA